MNNSEEASPVQGDGALKEEKSPNPAYQVKMQALDKLNLTFGEFNEVFSKVKQSFQVFKTKSFFFPRPEFTKTFGEHLKQTESMLEMMGNLLKKETGDKCDDKTFPVPSLNASDLPLLPSHTPDHSDIPGKTSGVAGITPPASEVGSDEILARNLENTCGGMKRKTRASESPQKSKRPKRSLIDSYLIKDESVSKKTKEEEDEEEEEFEVESIIDFKKTQGNYLYHVTWKGYGLNDSTWEPSSNLTSCEELLLEFFKSRLRKRDKEDPKSEDLSTYLHYDPSIKDTIRRAMFDYLSEPSEEDYKSILMQVISSKATTTTQKSQDLDELIEKTLITRKRDRYYKYLRQLLEDKLTKELRSKRDVQMAELRKWERKINTICSDPAKLCVENTVDLELPPMDFKYINECLAGEGVTIPSDPPVGCECEDCSTSKGCCASQMGSWTPYTKYGKLRISLGTPIYECNKRCSCGPNCSNRVVQKGRNISLCIFRTANGRGWGVKAMENIKKDSLVTEYVGEVISSEEAERRGKIYDAQNCTYLFDLDYNKGDQNPYTVDAAKCGNVSHFINHSCDPNLVVFNVWVNCLDPDLPRLALFASQDIKKGEELTFDYNSGLETEANALKDIKGEECMTPEKKESQDASSELFMKTPKGNRGLQYGKTLCKCGAANCRQYFF